MQGEEALQKDKEGEHAGLQTSGAGGSTGTGEFPVRSCTTFMKSCGLAWTTFGGWMWMIAGGWQIFLALHEPLATLRDVDEDEEEDVEVEEGILFWKKKKRRMIGMGEKNQTNLAGSGGLTLMKNYI
ncbi:hypothetical protein HPP92_017112 [Vanilla planifolia]|uniref:Uncharacterized protein n=1 Tax=Vanilla planifolia TaxID=51239 RepID=A0A835ULJ3_VANPL|nr:hypothetical protein HPP92_017667 [Vanilla planifolia]KAG0467784.1 hypothetical protein HPP92_017112 [Vanilla planifolia]